MTKLLIKPAAEEDLINIWIYIARDNPNAADKVLEAVYQTLQTLLKMPEIGTKYQSYRRKLAGIRFIPVKNYKSYVVYYRSTDKGIEITRVLHSRMKKESRLANKIS